MSLSVIISLHNTLTGIGVKALLEEYFNIKDIIICDNLPDSIDSNTFIITDPETFTEQLDYFLPKKHKCILISSKNSADAGFISSNDSLSEIIDNLNRIINNFKSQVQEQTQELSQREIEVLQLIAEGLINKQIADRLNISINTVLSHRKNISSKLGIKSVSGLSVYAMMHGYITNK